MLQLPRPVLWVQGQPASRGPQVLGWFQTQTRQQHAVQQPWAVLN